MAFQCIQSLNYMSSGKDRIFINLDTQIDYELSSEIDLLNNENKDTLMSMEDKAVIQIIPHDIGCKTSSNIEKYNLKRIQNNKTYEIEIGQQNDEVNYLIGLDNKSNKIYPMYDMLDVSIKSASYNKMDNFKKFDNIRSTHSDIYLPQLSSDIVQFIQVNERTYLLTPQSNKAASYMYSQYKYDGSNYYSMKLNDDQAYTTIYKPLTLLSVNGIQISSYQEYFDSDDKSISQIQDKIDDLFEPYIRFKGVGYNTLVGVLHKNSGDVRQLSNYSQFENGNIYGDMYVCKNMYDSQYSMKMSSDHELNNCREYVGMTFNGNHLFLKYIDGTNYIGNTQTLSGKNTLEKQMSDTIPYQKIETFEPITIKNQSESMHKSNFYSIRIFDSGLSEEQIQNNSEEDKKMLNMIKNDITQAVRKIAENIAPINTQLFEVQFQD